jgi:hypothetical protein
MRMFRRGRVRPSKSSSVMGMVVGIIFVIIGVTTVIPGAGAFGIFWTFGAIAITGFHAYNVFSEKGVSYYQVDVDYRDEVREVTEDFDSKLRKLKKLKDDGILSDEEYQAKKEQLLNEKW